ncbi:unnamed protein product [Caenorhabditis brenneri]
MPLKTLDLLRHDTNLKALHLREHRQNYPPDTQASSIMPNPKSANPLICYKNGKYVGMTIVQTRLPSPISDVFSSLIASGFKSKYNVEPQTFVEPTTSVQEPVLHEFETQTPKSDYRKKLTIQSSRPFKVLKDPSLFSADFDQDLFD